MARVRDGCGRRRFAVESGSNCARHGTESGSQVTFSLLCYAVLWYFASVATLCALEPVHQSNALHSCVLQCYFCVVQSSLCRSQWMAAPRLLEWYLQDSVESCDPHCVLQLSLCRSEWDGCVKVPPCCVCVQNTFVFSSWDS